MRLHVSRANRPAGRSKLRRAATDFVRFTLIELLVAVAIIAILASLLLPVLGRAKYTTRLAVCMSNQRQAAMAAMMYADEYNGFWPVRTGIEKNKWGVHAWRIAHTGDNWDDRPHLVEHFSNETFHCPFTVPVDLFGYTGTQAVASSFNLYMGFDFDQHDTSRPLRKITDTMTFKGKEFDILLCDENLIVLPGAGVGWAPNGYTFSAHPDRRGLALNLWTKSEDLYGSDWRPISQWRGKFNWTGGMDYNYTRTDGSVFRVGNIQPQDDRLEKVNYMYKGGGNSYYSLLPAKDAF